MLRIRDTKFGKSRLVPLAVAGIPRWQGKRLLRLHDLRHSFTVLRLTLWYRQQAPLGNLLPALATYLGHVGASPARSATSS